MERYRPVKEQGNEGMKCYITRLYVCKYVKVWQ